MISKAEVQRIAKLARIELKETEVEKFQKDLGEILDYFEILKELDTAAIEPMTHSVLHENRGRNDEPKRQLPEAVGKLMELAPSLQDGFLKVKAIFSKGKR